MPLVGLELWIPGAFQVFTVKVGGHSTCYTPSEVVMLVNLTKYLKAISVGGAALALDNERNGVKLRCEMDR